MRNTFSLFLALACCTGSLSCTDKNSAPGAAADTPVAKTAQAAPQVFDRELEAIETSLAGLTSEFAPENVSPPDTLVPMPKDASIDNNDPAVVQLRLQAIRESIDALRSAGHIMKTATADKTAEKRKCREVIVGWKSCNCRPPDVSGGAVHCDLCPIKKTVCD